jgi:hypothetical protein
MLARNLGELDLVVELVEAIVEAAEQVDVLLVLPSHLRLRAVSLRNQSPWIRRQEQEQIEPHAGLDQGRSGRALGFAPSFYLLHLRFPLDRAGWSLEERSWTRFRARFCQGWSTLELF